MGALLSLPITLLNFLLPFTKPGTPVTQDLIHTAVLCGTLYYAPQIAEWYNKQRLAHTHDGTEHTPGVEETQHHEPPGIEQVPELHAQEEEDQAGPANPYGQRPPAPQVEDFDEPVVHPLLPNDNNNDDGLPAAAAAGPANHRPRATPANRPIGAKKAKSLARKDQRRAYHEFHRQEAELRRLQEAEGAAEREAQLSAEKARRAKIGAEIAERERAERERRKEEERREGEEENRRRERVVKTVGEGVKDKGAVDLVDVAWKEGKDRVWVERLVRASGLLAQLSRDGGHAMITGQGWLVMLDDELMKRVYADTEAFGPGNGGKISFAEFGGVLEKSVLARAKV